ncbi:hypothetical protein H5410_009201 [Solanum commersonii]|uniref:Uncharacterized protein n=1 Tax=Solanum commersonii TaxID=4109 RepID=A0A9J6AIY0_SOLCO|nr:hypothetical protein H5410_009201 [Solanum commersonii]
MPFGCRLWRNILKGWEDFKVNISFKVGNGKRINLWKHTDLTIQQIRRTLSSDFLRFRRDFHDWEVTELHRLLAILHRQVISFDNSDALQWGSGLWGIMEFPLGVILTAQNLRKRKTVYVSWCYIDVDHRLLHCVFTMRFWWDMLQWFGTFGQCQKLWKI